MHCQKDLAKTYSKSAVSSFVIHCKRFIMGNDFKKQTSTVSAKQALDFLLAQGFQVGQVREVLPVDDIPKAYRKDVLAARRRFGDQAAISNTGRSIVLVGPHSPSGRMVEVHVPLFEMLRHGELDKLQQMTGLMIG